MSPTGPTGPNGAQRGPIEAHWGPKGFGPQDGGQVAGWVAGKSPGTDFEKHKERLEDSSIRLFPELLI